MQPFSVLIICHANTSRSVMAQALLERLLHERGREDHVRVASGGIAAYARDGALASFDARLVLRDEGIHLDPETASTDLKRNREIVAAADLILAMTDEQLEMLARDFPESHGKAAYTLHGFAGAAGDIEDPARRDEEFFAACLADIKGALEAGFPRLVALVDAR